MPDVTFTFSAAHLTRAINAMTVRYGYSTTLPDGSANPETAAQFTKRTWRQMLVDAVLEHERNTARAAVADPVPLDVA
jgi:hypothetical protein